MSSQQRPSEKFADESVLRAAQLMTQDLANHFGNVHGGEVMHLVDNIAYVCAARYCGGVAVTASVDRIDFHEPIHVGELLHLVARIVYVGRSSMDVEIDVHAEDIPTGHARRTNSCHFTMVALLDGRPTTVPRLICRTREDKARYVQARLRREMGLRYREERDRLLQQFADLDDDALDTLIKGEQA